MQASSEEESALSDASLQRQLRQATAPNADFPTFVQVEFQGSILLIDARVVQDLADRRQPLLLVSQTDFQQTENRSSDQSSKEPDGETSRTDTVQAIGKSIVPSRIVPRIEPINFSNIGEENVGISSNISKPHKTCSVSFSPITTPANACEIVNSKIVYFQSNNLPPNAPANAGLVKQSTLLRKRTDLHQYIPTPRTTHCYYRFNTPITDTSGISESDIFRCRKCRIKFLDYDAFRTHLTTHLQTKFEGIIECRACCETFETWTLQKAHEKSGVHSPLRCEICSETFTAKARLKEHRMSHFDAKPFACETCGRRYERKNGLKRHLHSHSKMQNWLQCDQCGKKFCSRSRLNCHLMSHSNKRPFSCRICKLRFKTETGFRGHMIIHSNLRPFECKQCNMKCKTKGRLSKHMMSHSSDRPHECSVCGKRFKARNHLLQHLVVHLDEWPYKCPDCDKVFKWKAKMTQHRQSHSVGYECNECSSRFESKRVLINHLKTHSFSGSKIDSVNCLRTRSNNGLKSNPGLKKRSSKVNSVNRAFDSSTDDNVNESHNTYYECNECSLKFKKKSALIRHLKTHSFFDSHDLVNRSKTDVRSYQSLNVIHERMNNDGVDQLQPHSIDDSWGDIVKDQCAVQPVSQNAIYKYNNCSTRLDSNGDLENHMESHASKDIINAMILRTEESHEMTHSCDICMNQFSSKSDFLNHLNTHGYIGSSRMEGDERINPTHLEAFSQLESTMDVNRALGNDALAKHSHAGSFPGARNTMLENRIAQSHASNGSNVEISNNQSLLNSKTNFAQQSNEKQCQNIRTLRLRRKNMPIFKCHDCILHFATLHEWQEHLDTHSGDVSYDAFHKRPVRGKIELYGCSDCSLRFESINTLADHLKIHSAQSIPSTKLTISPYVQLTKLELNSDRNSVDSQNTFISGEKIISRFVWDRFANKFAYRCEEKIAVNVLDLQQEPLEVTQTDSNGFVLDKGDVANVSEEPEQVESNDLLSYDVKLETDSCELKKTETPAEESTIKKERIDYFSATNNVHMIPIQCDQPNAICKPDVKIEDESYISTVDDPIAVPRPNIIDEGSPYNESFKFKPIIYDETFPGKPQIENSKRLRNRNVTLKLFSEQSSKSEPQKNGNFVKRWNTFEEEQYTCAICDRIFCQKMRIESHIMHHFNIRPHKCNICCKRFVTKVELAQHMIVHSDERPFECSQCSKCFKTARFLRSHMLVHTDLKSFVCTTCGKQYKTKDSLRKHRLIHSCNNLFNCDVCGRGFVSRYNIKCHFERNVKCLLHLRMMQGGKTSKRILNLKPHVCATCGKQYITKDSLRKHRLIHLRMMQGGKTSLECDQGSRDSELEKMVSEFDQPDNDTKVDVIHDQAIVTFLQDSTVPIDSQIKQELSYDIINDEDNEDAVSAMLTD